MKKFLLSFGLVLAFAFYSLLAQSRNEPVLPAPSSSAPGISTDPQNSGDSGQTASGQTPAAQPAQRPASIPKTAKTGLYADGTYTGNAADAYYGTVQVQVEVRNGRIANVQFLDYPHDRGTSIYINSVAMPQLTAEAVQAQSPNVDIVSGATDTSLAFEQSLQSALSRAVNS